MRELNTNEIKEVNGGVWVIVTAVAAAVSAGAAVYAAWRQVGQQGQTGAPDAGGPRGGPDGIECESGQELTYNKDGSGSCTN